MITGCRDLKAGNVFTWENYPLVVHEQKERRWFIFLGFRALDTIVYQITTTTQYSYYTEGGSRIKNNFFQIDAGTGGFPAASIVDLTLYFEEVHEKVIADYMSDITVQGLLPQNWINKLVKHVKIDRHIPTIKKKDIYQYLRNAGFTVTV